MLGKLMKHEFKATAKSFGAMYLIVLVIGGVLKIVGEIEERFNVNNMILQMILGVCKRQVKTVTFRQLISSTFRQ